MTGAARRRITPPLGTILYGYPLARKATSVGDDLHVVAAAFAYMETKALLLSADICSCPADFVEIIRKEISKQTGIDRLNIIFCATHTHSGPNIGLRKTGWGEPNSEYVWEILLPNSVDAAVEAVKNLRPARFAVGTAPSQVGCNRRVVSPDGTVELGQNPWGVFDDTMTVLSFKDAETEQCILNVIHYSAHATASAENEEITRDWPGVMKDVLEKETGGISMFLAGAIGECGPRCPNGKTTQSYEAAKLLGARAGLDAIAAWRSIKDWKNCPMQVTHGSIRIPYENLPPKELAQKKAAWLESEENLKDQACSDDIPRRKAEDMNELIRWKSILAAYDSGKVETEFLYHQSVLTIGDAAIVPMPFELFLYPTLQLRMYSKFQHTLSVSNANGSWTYLPSQDQMCRGGYEVWQFRYANTYKMGDNADDCIVAENLKILNEAHFQQRV